MVIVHQVMALFAKTGIAWRDYAIQCLIKAQMIIEQPWSFLRALTKSTPMVLM
jgi:hypothetical protein